MTDDSKPTGAAVALDAETMRRIADLLPGVASLARANGAPDPSPADVVRLCVDVFHAQTFGAMLALMREERDRDRGAGATLN